MNQLIINSSTTLSSDSKIITSPKHYTLTLFQKASRLGLLTDKDYISFQQCVGQLLSELITYYNKGNSTSVTTDVSEMLLNSLLYAIDFYFLNGEDDMDAIASLHDCHYQHIKEIYEEGLELLDTEVVTCQKLYNNLSSQRLPLSMESYHDTINGIAQFFTDYDTKFQAHHCPCNIDYPLALPVDDIKLTGIFFIKDFILNLTSETKLLRYFSLDKVIELLDAYSKTINMSYTIDLFNIFELVYTQAFFKFFYGSEFDSLLLSQNEKMDLLQKLAHYSPKQLHCILTEQSNLLIKELGPLSKTEHTYLQRYMNTLINRLCALDHTCDNSELIISYAETRNSLTQIPFNTGEQLCTSEFIWLVERLEQVEISEKIHLFRTRLHNLHDVLDILTGESFIEEEYLTLYQYLSSLELSILSKIALASERITTKKSFLDTLKSNFINIDPWKSYLHQHLQQLTSDQLNDLYTLMSQIDYTELEFS